MEGEVRVTLIATGFKEGAERRQEKQVLRPRFGTGQVNRATEQRRAAVGGVVEAPAIFRREAVGGSAQAHAGMMRRDGAETTNPRSFGSGSSMRSVSDSDLGGPRGTVIRRELELPTFIRRSYA